MRTKIFVFGMPKQHNPFIGHCTNGIEKRLDEIANRLKALEDKFEDEFEDEDDFDEEPCMFDEPMAEKRFGAAFEVDEPRAEDYTNRWKFLEARKAFDNFVDAGEHCVELGLDKKNNAPITKCNAVRKRVGELPPIGINLIGETDWWNDDTNCFCW